MRLFSALLLLASVGLADTVTFRDGHTVTGSFLGGDARSLRVAVGDRVESYPLDQITSITFNGGASASAVPAPAPAPRREEPRAERKETSGTTLASGTVLTVRMVDSVDSQRDRVGQTF